MQLTIEEIQTINDIKEKYKQDGEISISDFFKIKDLVSYYTSLKIGLICPKCHKNFTLSFQSLLTRLNHGYNNTDLCLCIKCNRKYKKQTMPEELKEYYKKHKIISFKLYIKYASSYSSTKLKVIFNCSECKKKSILNWDDLENRTYFKRKPICKHCILKKSASTDQFKINNRNSQLIAQNRPEVIEKQRNKQLEIIQTEGYETYVNKRTINKKSSLSGYKNGIFFDGSYELSFMYWADSRGYTYNRSSDIIEYEYNHMKHIYYPDFWLNIDNRLYLVEVKGYINEKVEVKNKSAKEYVKQQNNNYYAFLFFDDNFIKTLPDWKKIRSTKQLNDMKFKNLIITSFPKKWMNKKGVIYQCNLQK